MSLARQVRTRAVPTGLRPRLDGRSPMARSRTPVALSDAQPGAHPRPPRRTPPTVPALPLEAIARVEPGHAHPRGGIHIVSVHGVPTYCVGLATLWPQFESGPSFVRLARPSTPSSASALGNAGSGGSIKAFTGASP
jgi:hypothetical protein